MREKYPTTIARLQALLREQLGLELSGAELAELLWLRLQWGDIEEVTIEAVEPQNELPIGALDIQFSDQVLEVENVVLPQTATLAASSPSEQEMRPKDVLPLQVPEAMALRNQRAIGRSLRPLLRKVPSGSRRVMLEDETAIAIAERQIWDPVMRAESERWLDLAIVIEETRSYGVWWETLAEFRQLLERHGAFRSVKTWHLKPNDFGELQLFSSSTSSHGRSVRSVLSADGRRLVMLMSDCTARSWQSGEMLKVVELWSRKNPVTIVQLLPPSYWERTALRSGHSVGLRSQVAGALSRDWQVTGLSAVRRSWLPMDGLKFPVVTIEAEALGEWAKAMAAGVSVTSGFVLDRSVLVDRETEPSRNSTPKSPEELVRQFRATASGEAQSLAAVLAMFPVVNGVIRLIQKTVLETETIALYLAEMVLSGLLVRVDRSGQDYDFVMGVRSAIRARVERDVAIEVAEDVAEAVVEHLPEEVRDRVSADIARRFGHSIGWFEAFLYADLDWGDEAIAAQMMPFADVTAETLRDWGGQYAEMVDRLEQGLPTPNPTPSTSSLKSSAKQLEELNVESLLQPVKFQFKTANVEIQRSRHGIFNVTSKIVLVKSNGVVQGYTEPLDGSVGIDMVGIPAGEFRMGTAKSEEAFDPIEGPLHFVKVPQFHLGRYQVTQAQWRIVAGWPVVSRVLKSYPSKFEGEDKPVDSVSWLDSIEFCHRLSVKTQRDYRLPSEAEWEYACRAGTTTPFYFGKKMMMELANYSGSSVSGRYDYYENAKLPNYRDKTTPVGIFPANAFGSYDMHGNLWEWCKDDWHGDYQGAPIDGSIPWEKFNRKMLERTMNTNPRERKVVRGGSWSDDPRKCRSACRNYFFADNFASNIGFRVVCGSLAFQ